MQNQKFCGRLVRIIWAWSLDVRVKSEIIESLFASYVEWSVRKALKANVHMWMENNGLTRTLGMKINVGQARVN